MKVKWRRSIFLSGIIGLFAVAMLAGCKSEEKVNASQAYYVISEELDIKKTADKAQEILENTGSKLENKAENEEE